MALCHIHRSHKISRDSHERIREVGGRDEHLDPLPAAWHLHLGDDGTAGAGGGGDAACLLLRRSSATCVTGAP